VLSPGYTRALPERFRDKGLIIKRYINSSVYVYFTLLLNPAKLTLFYYSSQWSKVLNGW